MKPCHGQTIFRGLYNVSRETMDMLVAYENCLIKWNPAINLVSKQSMADLWTRHIQDSAQLWALMPKTATSLIDLGAGAGFPGMVLAILAKENSTPLKISLIEADQRKCSFLQYVCREIGLEPEIIAERIENIPSLSADVITARALAPLDQLLEFAERHKSTDGCCIFQKGRNVEKELTEARKNWTFKVQKTQSQTDPSGTILTIRDIRRV